MEVDIRSSDPASLKELDARLQKAVDDAVVDVENILRRDFHNRWILTFAFGLIHGCGFTSLLRDAGVGANGGGVVAPLISFNLGVIDGVTGNVQSVADDAAKLKPGIVSG